MCPCTVWFWQELLNAACQTNVLPDVMGNVLRGVANYDEDMAADVSLHDLHA